jgi:hypothetical protein
MSPRENRDFYRENVETLRTAFQEILHHHFLLLSAFVPKMVETIKASLSESLTDGTEIEGEKVTSALNTLFIPNTENAIFYQMPRATAISSIDVAKAIEFDFRYLEQGDIAALKDVLDHQQEAFELFLTMIPSQLGIAREILDPFQIRMNALMQNSKGEKRFRVEYLKSKEDLMPTNLRLWVHKANVALDYLQDTPAPTAVVDLPIPISRSETRRPVWSSTDNSFAELIVELHKKGYINGPSPMDVLGAVAPLFENVNPDGRTLWQGIANRAHKGNRFSSIPTAPKPRKKTRPAK